MVAFSATRVKMKTTVDTVKQPEKPWNEGPSIEATEVRELVLTSDNNEETEDGSIYPLRCDQKATIDGSKGQGDECSNDRQFKFDIDLVRTGNAGLASREDETMKRYVNMQRYG
jgi:hypothetical protein